MSAFYLAHDAATRALLAARLSGYARHREPAEGLKPAAVSIVLLPLADGTTGFLLTLRAPRLRAHSGQYALPGGRLDPGESPAEAALRELHEELGIAAGAEAILGQLDDLPTRAGYRVSPFVLWLEGAPQITPAPEEIARVFRVPLADLFAGPGRGGNREDAIGADEEPGVFCRFIPTLGHDLFAPTAAILDHFRHVCLTDAPRPAVRFGEPAFARR